MRPGNKCDLSRVLSRRGAAVENLFLGASPMRHQSYHQTAGPNIELDSYEPFSQGVVIKALGVRGPTGRDRTGVPTAGTRVRTSQAVEAERDAAVAVQPPTDPPRE